MRKIKANIAIWATESESGYKNENIACINKKMKIHELGEIPWIRKN